MKQERVTYKLFECDEIKSSQYRENGNKIPWKLLIIATCVVFCLYILIREYNLLISIFFDKSGNFQWVGITSIVAILTFGYSIYSTNKKNKYDVISKERIRWINDVKQQITELLVLMNEYYDIVRNCGEKSELLQLSTSDELKLRDKYHKDANLLMKDISFKVNLLLLSFADNSDNKQIINCIEDASKWVDSFNEYWTHQSNPMVNVTFTFDNVPIRNLMIVSRDYLSREWHRAQKGK